MIGSLFSKKAKIWREPRTLDEAAILGVGRGFGEDSVRLAANQERDAFFSTSLFQLRKRVRHLRQWIAYERYIWKRDNQ